MQIAFASKLYVFYKSTLNFISCLCFCVQIFFFFSMRLRLGKAGTVTEVLRIAGSNTWLSALAIKASVSVLASRAACKLHPSQAGPVLQAFHFYPYWVRQNSTWHSLQNNWCCRHFIFTGLAKQHLVQLAEHSGASKSHQVYVQNKFQ
jgi:hypothetical protein